MTVYESSILYVQGPSSTHLGRKWVLLGLNILAYIYNTGTKFARDTTREINETAKELKDRGVIKHTATAVEETAAAAREIGETARHTAQQVRESAPLTGETIRKAATGVKTRTKRST